MTVRDLAPTALWGHFADLSALPRESLHEEAARAFVVARAEAWGLSWAQDVRGNLVVRKAASPGREGRPTVVLQAHLDMVCEQDRGGTHNFATDPLTLVVDDGWVRAQGTTLGADDGIGVAAILAILEDRTLVHGPLEALFTLDEETEMSGALALDPTLVTGRLLLNLDGEGPGHFVVGSAGGGTTTGLVPLTFSPTDEGAGWLLVLDGLVGGHSGVEIQRQQGNALGLLGRLVSEFLATQPRGLWQLARLEGGDKDNAIPRVAEALLAGPGDPEGLRRFAEAFQTRAADELGPEGRDLRLTLAPAPVPPRVLTPASQQTFLDLVAALPDGVRGRSKVVPGLVETSANLGRIRFFDAQAEVVVSQRSSSAGLLAEVMRSTVAAFRLAGGSVDRTPTYPAWTPNPESRLRTLVPTLWERTVGTPAVLEITHAGLECGILAEKLPGADLISYGPDLQDIHTTQERVEAASVDQFYRFTLALLEAL